MGTQRGTHYSKRHVRESLASHRNTAELVSLCLLRMVGLHYNRLQLWRSKMSKQKYTIFMSPIKIDTFSHDSCTSWFNGSTRYRITRSHSRPTLHSLKSLRRHSYQITIVEPAGTCMLIFMWLHCVILSHYISIIHNIHSYNNNNCRDKSN